MFILLPEQYRKALARTYAKRLLVVALFAIGVSLFLFLLAMVPTYVFAVARRNAANDQLKTVRATQDPTVATSSVSVVDLVAETASLLDVPAHSSVVVLEALDTIAGSEIQVSNVALVSDDQNRTMRVEISGIALTRQSLLDFSARLQDSELFEEAKVPVSSLVKESDIPFSMTVQVTPLQP